MAKKKNWDLIRNQKDDETVKYRDVYEDQQLERGSIAAKETMTSRIVLAIIASIVVFFMVWAIVSLVQMFTGKEGLDDDANPADDYIKMQSCYYNPKDTSDIISAEEYEKWYKIYHDYDSKRSASDEPPEAPVDDTAEYMKHFSYNTKTGTYGYSAEKYGDVKPKEYSASEYQKMVSDHYAEYQKKYDDYMLYYYRHTDPEYRKDDEGSGIYAKAADLYRNVSTNSVITAERYDNKVKEYQQGVENGSISEDIQAIPLKPVDWSKVYKPNTTTYISWSDLWAMDGLDLQSVPNGASLEAFKDFIAYCKSKEINIVTNPCPSPLAVPNPNDEKAVKKYKSFQDYYAKLKSVFPEHNFSSYNEYWDLFEVYCTAIHYDRNSGTYVVPTDMTKTIIDYKSVYDGSVIPRKEYKELVKKYEQDIVKYDQGYKEHREQFHPDNIDGESMTYSFAPNLIKILVSLVFAGFMFGILYFILKKNLKAQNIMSDTSDINQYHNDQHVALPEEVQKNYDWFPDVGAHSSVQVSSMISHMAISNKGLKTITMAKRADKDIKDENGDIEYYKGEILLDKDGNPKTKEAPIIDTDFMEALFDASGATKNKDKRRYYDTTKIPYNPGNGNRDKLSGYDTVADLINNDWEFPLYEPQRPAGAYIVDTAPVNTINFVYHVINA